MKNHIIRISIALIYCILTSNLHAQNCVDCTGSINTGSYSTAIGQGAQATGEHSMAFGQGSVANTLRSFAFGNSSTAAGWSSFAIGNLVTTTAMNAFALGMGCSPTQLFSNQTPYSLAIGFNSTIPTLFIGTSDGPGTSGKVGIGTATPGEKLSVAGTIESKSGGFRFPDGSVQVSKAFSPWHDGGSGKITYTQGNVGIGTGDPKATLDVHGDIVLGKPGENFILHARPWVGDALIIAPQNNNGGWDWSKSFTLKDNGQVFIGGDLSFISPHTGYKLAVNGKAISKEVVVSVDGWADHVFEESYQLLSLPDLERFIQQNNHLPGVPVAESVLQQGIALGEMNKILLTKVEELTLYVINMQKEIESFRSDRIQEQPFKTQDHD